VFIRWISLPENKSALIIGPRRSGKTTLLRGLFPDFNYIPLDNLDYYDWVVNNPKGLVDSLGPKFILDEIQRRPRLTIAVKKCKRQWHHPCLAHSRSQRSNSGELCHRRI